MSVPSTILHIWFWYDNTTLHSQKIKTAKKLINELTV